MRLREHGFQVRYEELSPDLSGNYEDQLSEFVNHYDLDELVHFEIEDRFFADRISEFCQRRALRQRVLSSPMFLCTRAQFSEYARPGRRPYMADFYKRQRRHLGLLLNDDGSPRGDRWSFDIDNRKRLPEDLALPPMPSAGKTRHTQAVIDLVEDTFPGHPGIAGQFWWPVTRRQARVWLEDFLHKRLADFGAYQDAISQRSETSFHSVLSPLLNLGLLTPAEVIEATVRRADDVEIPLNSLEGFVRQIIGWREFLRGVYHTYGEQQGLPISGVTNAR